MITNPSCQASDVKESEQKFLAPNFEEDLPEIGGSGNGPVGGNPGSQNVPPTSLTDLSGYNSHSYSQHGSHNHYNGHYNHYNNSWHQSPDYNYYQQGYYGGGGGHYGAPGQPMYHQDQWAGTPAHQGMVLPPGPSPTGSNNSPSPHGFSDTNDDHLPHRTDLKRPSPDSFVPHSSLGPQSLHHQPPVTKKPKVSKRRKKRDPNEPQKPVSAYALFFRDTQASIKLRHPNANFGEVSKIVASTWDSLDPEAKGQYKKKTEMAKKEYLRALAAYRANLVSKVSKCQKHHKFLKPSKNILRSGTSAVFNPSSADHSDSNFTFARTCQKALCLCVSMSIVYLESSLMVGKDVMLNGKASTEPELVEFRVMDGVIVVIGAGVNFIANYA